MQTVWKISLLISDPVVCLQFFHFVPRLDPSRKMSLPGVVPRRTRYSSEKTYVCQYAHCGKTFYQKYNLYRHQREKHGSLYPWLQSNQGNGNSWPFLYVCQLLPTEMSVMCFSKKCSCSFCLQFSFPLAFLSCCIVIFLVPEIHIIF